MNIITINISENDLNNIKKYLQSNIVDNDNKNILCIFKYNDSTITIYKTLKMVIQSKKATLIYKELTDNNIITKNDYDIKQTEINEPNQNELDTIGCDEVGVGDFFGGLVTSACYVRKEDINYLIDIGVKDSKKLSDKKILDLFPLIIKKVRYATTYLNPKEYNEKYDIYKNSHIIKTLLHNESICKLKSSIKDKKNTYIIMDEYCNRENYEKYLNKINPKEIAHIDLFKTKAESHYISVACASIIARVYFLKQIELLNEKIKQYNLSILLGNNSDVQNLASKIYKKNNKLLDNLVKKHFITYNKIIGENNE